VAGVIGATGLGRRIAEQAAAFVYQGIAASVLASSLRRWWSM
jgi:hypothetical protein